MAPTTCIIAEDRTGRHVLLIVERGPVGERSLLILNSSRTPGELNVLIRWVTLETAAGEKGENTLLVALQNTPEDVFFHMEVLGLGNTNQPGLEGHLYFCN
jgi:hypothetical protein